MPNWISEFDKWAPSVKVVSYKGTPTQRKTAQGEIRRGEFQVLLTTYEYIIKVRFLFFLLVLPSSPFFLLPLLLPSFSTLSVLFPRTTTTNASLRSTQDRPLLSKTKWLHMIIDEGHRMKNASSKLSVTLTQYYSSRYRLILTGTPLQVRFCSSLPPSFPSLPIERNSGGLDKRRRRSY